MDQTNNCLVKITDLTTQLGLSSRSLRYYEQVGLIQSVRPAFEKYRFYDAENIERLRQIMVLRKMQIPVKDILRIYESESMSVVVETFVNRIQAIDEEIGALSELKRIVSEFLHTMRENGVTKISALPLLYEEMDKQIELIEEIKPVTYKNLSNLSERLAKPVDPVIVSLPAFRVVSSFLKASPKESDVEGFWRWIQTQKIFIDNPGQQERFEYQTDMGDVMIQRIPDDFINDSEYSDFIFDGGLFAAVNVYLDEDLGERFHSLVTSFDDNKFYQVDYNNGGGLRNPAMLENLISPDEKRSLVTLFVPVKKRLADPSLFDLPEEVTDIRIDEIEAANPVLWQVDVPLDKLTPINNPHYRITEDGEVEYTGWISTRVLSTNVSVKLPFRVDVVFRVMGTGERFSYGDSEGSIILYHGEDLSYYYGINMGNRRDIPEEALRFHQPIFRDRFDFHQRGRIMKNDYNRLTWIVGTKHLAVFINDELRYCGKNFPYMHLDLRLEKALPIIIGSNGQGIKYFRSIRVSQLMGKQKNKTKERELVMITKQNNNIISNIHRLVTSEHGENYWFNGCAKYVMECLGERDYDYWLFAGLTGDVFTQHYTYTKYFGDALSSYMMDENPKQFVKDTFAKCGYAATYVSLKELKENSEMYLNTLTSYIDKGIPVMIWGYPVGVLVGYEDYGKVLLYITGDKNQPERMTLEKALSGHDIWDPERKGGWIFVGERKENRPLAQLYREAIKAIPGIQSIKTDSYCFGAEAFRAWARDIGNGKFDNMTTEEFDPWGYHTNYVCVLATNGSCCHEYLKRAQNLNPDMTFLEEISRLYKRIGEMWNNDHGTDLEALGGGFNVSLEVLQDKERRSKIAAKIREFAKVTDEIVRVLTERCSG
ncbi:MAG TPA: hypothetical protein DDZ89_08760 [Clostridiales bacterium]|nr:hypothetical protein [Clostridiales bacterium]